MVAKKIPLPMQNYLEHLDGVKKSRLLKQISSLDATDLEEQKTSFLHPIEIVQKSWPSLKKCSSPRAQDVLKGKKAYKEGKAAFVILAGGQGVRLGWDKPKGCFPITIVKHKSLFQIFCEKIFYAQKYYNQEFELVIMVSDFNGKETENFFEENHYFGLKKEQIHFVYQKSLPVFDKNGLWQLAKEDEIAFAPNGNGQVFHLLAKEGFLEKWKNKKIETVTLFSIDNPLANPFNEEFLGLHLREKNDLTMQAIPQEKNCGALVSLDKKVSVLEYLYLNGNEKYFFSNINFFFFSLPFAFQMAKEDSKIGYHFVLKKSPIYSDGKMEVKEILKSEKFLFDHFIYAKRFGCLLSSKQKCFCPLKAQGDIESIQQILLKQDEEQCLKIFKQRPLKKIFELSQEFYYLKMDQKKAYQKNSIQNLEYIDTASLE